MGKPLSLLEAWMPGREVDGCVHVCVSLCFCACACPGLAFANPERGGAVQAGKGLPYAATGSPGRTPTPPHMLLLPSGSPTAPPCTSASQPLNPNL